MVTELQCCGWTSACYELVCKYYHIVGISLEAAWQVFSLTGRARLLIACCNAFLHHQTKGKITVEITHLMLLNWAWDACWKEEMEDKYATCLVYQSQGWLITKSVPRAVLSSDFWLALKAAVVLWIWPLSAELSSMPRAGWGKLLTWLLPLSTIPGYLLKHGILSCLVKGVWGPPQRHYTAVRLALRRRPSVVK